MKNISSCKGRCMVIRIMIIHFSQYFWNNRSQQYLVGKRKKPLRREGVYNMRMQAPVVTLTSTSARKGFCNRSKWGYLKRNQKMPFDLREEGTRSDRLENVFAHMQVPEKMHLLGCMTSIGVRRKDFCARIISVAGYHLIESVLPAAALFSGKSLSHCFCWKLPRNQT